MNKIETIKKSIKKDGYFLCHNEEYVKYSDILHCIGDIILESDIKIKPESKRYIHRANELPLHTDSPEANIIAWQCIEQDNISGDSIIFDSRKIIDQLDTRDIEILSDTFLPYPSITGRDEKFHPIIKHGENGYNIYYTPWYIDNSVQTKSLTKLDDLIKKNHSSFSKKIRLKPNQMLIIDNHRILHGRLFLPEKTSRHLKRFWLKNK